MYDCHTAYFFLYVAEKLSQTWSYVCSYDASPLRKHNFVKEIQFDTISVVKYIENV